MQASISGWLSLHLSPACIAASMNFHLCCMLPTRRVQIKHSELLQLCCCLDLKVKNRVQCISLLIRCWSLKIQSRAPCSTIDSRYSRQVCHERLGRLTQKCWRGAQTHSRTSSNVLGFHQSYLCERRLPNF